MSAEAQSILVITGLRVGATETREQSVLAETVGELEDAIHGRAYLWPWADGGRTESARRAMPLRAVDAFSTAERCGFTVVDASAQRMVWRARALDAERFGQ